MQLYKVRRKNPDTGQFDTVYIAADSLEEVVQNNPKALKIKTIKQDLIIYGRQEEKEED